MERFCRWFNDGEYTPFGETFDIGGATERAICRYMKNPDPYSCGETGGRDNGNGSLMRIMPACLFAYEQQKAGASDEETLKIIHEVGGLTHNHLRAKIACRRWY